MEVFVEKVEHKLAGANKSKNRRRRTETPDRFMHQHHPDYLKQVTLGVTPPVELGTTKTLQVLDKDGDGGHLLSDSNGLSASHLLRPWQ